MKWKKYYVLFRSVLFCSVLFCSVLFCSFETKSIFMLPDNDFECKDLFCQMDVLRKYKEDFVWKEMARYVECLSDNIVRPVLMDSSTTVNHAHLQQYMVNFNSMY